MKAIEDLFEEYGSDREFRLITRGDGYYITVSQMYNYVGFKHGISTLVGYIRIAELLGVKDGDEIERNSSRGCKTCDWGSNYTIELKFW